MEIEDKKHESTTPDNGGLKEEGQAGEKGIQKDFKIAEIWIKHGHLKLEAAREFWMDKFRAIGVLEYCKDIVKDFVPPEEKSKIIQPDGNMMNFVRGLRKRNGKKK